MLYTTFLTVPYSRSKNTFSLKDVISAWLQEITLSSFCTSLTSQWKASSLTFPVKPIGRFKRGWPPWLTRRYSSAIDWFESYQWLATHMLLYQLLVLFVLGKTLNCILQGDDAGIDKVEVMVICLGEANSKIKPKVGSALRVWWIQPAWDWESPNPHSPGPSTRGFGPSSISTPQKTQSLRIQTLQVKVGTDRCRFTYYKSIRFWLSYLFIFLKLN